MSMFTLAISCLTTFNLPWFMDLTFQVPMQYCSLQHRTLLLLPITSTAGCCFCFGSVSSFFLELFLHWSPVAFSAPTNLGSSSFSVPSFCFFMFLFLGDGLDVDVTGDRSKVWCCKEQYCVGTWNVRSMNQGKLEASHGMLVKKKKKKHSQALSQNQKLGVGLRYDSDSPLKLENSCPRWCIVLPGLALGNNKPDLLRGDVTQWPHTEV